MKKLQEEIRSILPNFRLTTPAKINGRWYKLTESEVRYLQYKAAMAHKEGKFEEFCKNHKVYDVCNGKKVHNPFLPGGKFEYQFESGFYDTCVRFSLELLRYERELQKGGL